jgi:hypothetical protein
VRVRDHIALSTAGAVVLLPWVGRGGLAFWAGGVFIDADHYVWFCLRERSLSPREAVDFFNGAHAPQHRETRLLHSRPALLSALLLGLRRPRLLPLALGMSLHVAADAHHEARMSRARAQALKRDRFSCQICGTPESVVGTHVWRQPLLMPSYETQNVISLCGPCHELAHAVEQASATGGKPLALA